MKNREKSGGGLEGGGGRKWSKSMEKGSSYSPCLDEAVYKPWGGGPVVPQSSFYEKIPPPRRIFFKCV